MNKKSSSTYLLDFLTITYMTNVNKNYYNITKIMKTALQTAIIFFVCILYNESETI